MDCLVRRFIFFLMLTLVVNAGGWTFNKEAVADVWFGEQHESVVVDDANRTHAQAATSQAAATTESCDHCCHILSHFVGVFSNEAIVLAEFASEPILSLSVVINSSSPDGLFRPPRRFS